MITPNIWSIYECYNLYVHIVAQTKFVYIYIFIYSNDSTLHKFYIQSATVQSNALV